MYSPNLNFHFCETRPSSFDVNKHCHTCYELVYFKRANGKLNINNNLFELKSDCLYYVGPGSLHSETHLSDYEVIFLGFDCVNFPTHNLSEKVYNLSGNKLIYNLILRVVEEATNQNENHQEMTSHLLAELILLLERHELHGTDPKRSIEYAHNYIYEYFNQHIDFQELAKSTNYSYDRFRHLFYEKYHYSPKQLQMTIRLEKATELLSQREINCSEIAYQCGFSSSAQFSKLFKERYGISPKQLSMRHN